MTKAIQILALLSAAALASAQSPGTSSAAATAAAAPAALTTPAPTSGTVTGVPKYHAGFRGPKGTTAPVANRKMITAGATDSSAATGSSVASGSSVVAGSTGNSSVHGAEATAGAAKPDEPIPMLDVAQLPNPLGIKAGTPIVVKLANSTDSAHARNGDTLRGSLVSAVGAAPAGAPVELTVVAAAAAGQMKSYGEISLQVVRINGTPVLSNVVTAEGKEGLKVTEDSAPERGTEAAFTADQPISLPAA